MKERTKQMVLAALFIAISAICANIKIFGSIAFDAVPAFLGTLILGYGWGVAIAAIAHLLTAMTSGFPYGLPMHLVVSAMMSFTMIAFLWVIRFCQKRKLSEIVCYSIGTIVAVLVSSPVTLLVMSLFMGKAFAIVLLPVLTLASAANVILALILYHYLPCSLTGRKNRRV